MGDNSGAFEGDQRMSNSQADGFDYYFRLEYERLREIARRYLRGERPDHTWQGTELVHEAFMKLCEGEPFAPSSREHFLRVMSKKMHELLVDHARGKATQKRGGDRNPATSRIEVDAVTLADAGKVEEILAVADLLSRLEKLEAYHFEIVRLRFYFGLSVGETADALGMSKRTVEREWKLLRASLRMELAE